MKIAIPIELNNPGDIIWDGVTKWQGQDPITPYVLSNGHKFVKFLTPLDGVRAMLKIAYHYFVNDGIVNLIDFGLRWAPPADNGGDTTYGPKLLSFYNSISAVQIQPLDPFNFGDSTDLGNLGLALTDNEDGFVSVNYFKSQVDYTAVAVEVIGEA